MTGYESTAYKDGFRTGLHGGSWFACKWVGRDMSDWLRGYDAGRNQRAEEAAERKEGRGHG